MPFTRGQDVHPGTVWVWREPDERWTSHTCSFCGSVRPQDAAAWLEHRNDASGAEWKYSWPHKFYIKDDLGNQWKFYSEHLTELGPETFDKVSEVIGSALKIYFMYDTVGRMYVKAPSFGYQAWIQDGVDRMPSDTIAFELLKWDLNQNIELLNDEVLEGSDSA